MILGFSEKILAPELGVNFLEGHSWNFMNAIGLNFSDYLFTLSAGATEFILGLVFVLGIVGITFFVGIIAGSYPAFFLSSFHY